MHSLRAVLFDFGGVLVESPFAGFAAYERRSGLPDGLLRSVNARNPDGNAWARLERGDVDLDRFVELYETEVAAAGAEVDGREVIGLVLAVRAARADANSSMVHAAERCRDRGLRLGLVTNNVRPMRLNPDTDWVFDLFDEVVESCVVGVRKPGTEICAIACSSLGVNPAETVMLDDLGVNLKPAKMMGMQTIKVFDPIEAAEELLRWLPAD